MKGVPNATELCQKARVGVGTATFPYSTEKLGVLLMKKPTLDPKKINNRPKYGTARYFCPKCRYTHWYWSKIGTAHKLEAEFDAERGAVPRTKTPIPPLKLHLVLKHKWFDLIESGKKTVEYRDLKTFWINRIIKRHNPNGGNVVIFHKGYTDVTISFEIRMIVCNTPTEKIEIHLGKRLDGGTLSLKKHNDLAEKGVWAYCSWCPCEKCEEYRRTKKEGDVFE